ncbi:MAG: YlqD family protein [Desulfitobacteriaceae bacterium]
MEINTGRMILKKTVAIKAEVTETFKEYLVFELQNSMRSLEEKINQLGIQDEQQSKEKQDLLLKMMEAQALTIGSHFVQGTVDGIVELEIGDNLYEKLGGSEILIKDGIVIGFR